MRRLVNGEECEFDSTNVDVSTLTDRLVARTDAGAHTALVVRHKGAVLVSYRGRQYRVESISRAKAKAAGPSSGELRAPMPGVVVSVSATEGQQVAKGAVIVVLEAMKTQQPFVAPFDGVVERISVKIGQGVSEGTLLAFLVKTANDV